MKRFAHEIPFFLFTNLCKEIPFLEKSFFFNISSKYGDVCLKASEVIYSRLLAKCCFRQALSIVMFNLLKPVNR